MEVVALMLAIYVLPAVVALVRDHPQKVAIIVLTIVAGWTFIGWVVALVWAFVHQRPTAAVAAAPPAAPPSGPFRVYRFRVGGDHAPATGYVRARSEEEAVAVVRGHADGPISVEASHGAWPGPPGRNFCWSGEVRRKAG